MLSTEIFFKAFDFVLVFAVANHQVVVLFGNDEVVDALEDDIFARRDVDDAVVRFVEDDFGGVGNVVFLVFFTKGMKSVPSADI